MNISIENYNEIITGTVPYNLQKSQGVKYGFKIKDRNVLIMAVTSVVFFLLIIIVHNALSIFLVSIAFCLNDKEEFSNWNMII